MQTSGLATQDTKRRHSLIHLTITRPDGLILYLYGPYDGGRHDMTSYICSGPDEALQQHAVIDGLPYYIFGDSAFIIRPYLQIVFHSAIAIPEQVLFNTAMSRSRESVD